MLWTTLGMQVHPAECELHKRKQYVEVCVCCDVRYISGEADPLYH